MGKGLYITIADLSNASGISIKIIKKDINSSMLKASNELIWYYDAIAYSKEKWKENKTDMLSHEDFAERLLGIIDDNTAVNNLKQ